MKSLYQQLVLFAGEQDSLLSRLAALPQDSAAAAQCLQQLVSLSMRFGLSGNLWHGYLAYHLATYENPYSLAVERGGTASPGLCALAEQEGDVLYALLHLNLTEVFGKPFLPKLSRLTNFDGGAPQTAQAQRLCALSQSLGQAENGAAVLSCLTQYYSSYGVGQLGLYNAFGLREDGALRPIAEVAPISFSDLIGYDTQKQQLIDNTTAFVKGRRANNVLLYGDSGTGKSSSIKAALHRFAPEGLRMIEIYKHQLHFLPALIAALKGRRYAFVLYMDDLSFEDFEVEYKYLKGVIEGGLETRPQNILIYATSNRKHLIRELWTDREQQSLEVRISESMQEKLSLSARFGLSIYYGAPTQDEYFAIVRALCSRFENTLSDAQLLQRARIWELQHGGFSGRAAEQLVFQLLSEGILREKV